MQATPILFGLHEHDMARSAMRRNGLSFAGLDIPRQRRVFADLYEQVCADHDALTERYGDARGAAAAVTQAQVDWREWEDLGRSARDVVEGQRIMRGLYELGFDTPDVCDILGVSEYVLYRTASPIMVDRFGAFAIRDMERRLLAGESLNSVARLYDIWHASVTQIAQNLGIATTTPRHVYDYALDLFPDYGCKAAVAMTKQRFGRAAVRLTNAGLSTQRVRAKKAWVAA